MLSSLARQRTNRRSILTSPHSCHRRSRARETERWERSHPEVEQGPDGALWLLEDEREGPGAALEAESGN